MTRSFSFCTAAFRLLLPVATCAAAVLTTGCALSPTAPPASTVIPAIAGVVHGGQNPFEGSTVTLYTAGSSYAAGATPIGTATTAADGSFSILPSATSSDCPSGTQAYITAAGGYQAQNTNTNNPSALMMAALGDCKNISSSTNITINEVTTVAAAYALSGFMTASSGSAVVGGPTQGLAHAFLNAAALANYTTGIANTTVPTASVSPSSVTGTVPAAEINTLGNIMQSCINSDSSSVSQACTNLFLDTPSISGNIATNTLQAFINLARNPASSAAISGSPSTMPAASTTLLGLASATPAFQTSLGTAPADWSLSIVYTGGGIAPGYWLTLDQYDTPYVGLYSYTANTQSPILFGVSPYGRTVNTFGPNPNYNVTTAGTNTTTRGIAADAIGNIWVAINNASTSFSTAYQFYAPTGAYNRSFSDAYVDSVGLAVDSSNNLWVGHADSAGHVTEAVWNGLTTGAAWSEALDMTSLGYYGYGIALDANQNVWLAGENSSTSASLLPAAVLKEVTATATATQTSGSVSATTITVPGYYYATPTVTFSGGGCTTTPTGTAVLTATPGSVSSITVTNAGAGCTSAPTIAFSTALTLAAGTAVLSGATVGSVTITNGGYYAAVPTVTFTNGGCTTAATGTAVLTSNAVSSVTINTAGVGCTSAPTVTFSNPIPAMVTATLPDSLKSPYGISIDGSGNAWYTVLNTSTPADSGVVKATPGASTGATSITTPTYIVSTTAGTGAYAGNTLGIGSAEESAIDGAGTMFLGDVFSSAYGLHAFSTVTNGYILSPTKGFTGYATSGTSPMTSARGIAIDSTGSVWLDSSTLSQVTQVIGIAAPTVPLLAAGKSGTAPGGGVLALP